MQTLPGRTGPSVRSALAVLVLCCCLGALPAGLASSPSHVPLPWDMAHHSLRVSRFAEAIAARDLGSLIENLRYWDVYPPAMYVGVGAVQALVGSDELAWAISRAFGWLLIVGAVLLAAREHATRFALFVLLLVASNGMLLSLSGQRMLDFPAAAMALLALALLSRCDERARNAALACAGITLALLTKHNAGLPLVAVAFALAAQALWQRRRRRAVLVAGAALLSLGLWAAFLSWQDHGWEAFLSFARNRANTEAISPWRRLASYFSAFYDTHVGGWWVGAPFLALVILGSWKADRFARLCGLYALLVAIALARHPYFLERSFAAVALVLCVPAARALLQVPAGRLTRGALVVAGALLSLQVVGHGLPLARAETLRQVPPENERLAAPSRQLESWFRRDAAQRQIVLGSFRELSKPWLQNLHERARGGAALQVDLYYPLETSRSGLDARWDPLYAELFERHVLRGGYDFVYTITPRSESAWRGGDYTDWNAYKENYMRCAERSEALLLSERLVFEEAGVELACFRRAFQPAEFVDGWLDGESWGRWMRGELGELLLPVIEQRSLLLLELAPHHEQQRPIRVRLSCEGLTEVELQVRGEPWKFQVFSFEIGPESSRQILQLQMLDDGRAEVGNVRGLAVQNVGVVEGG